MSISQDGKSIIYITNDLTAVGSNETLDFDITNYSTQYDVSVTITCSIYRNRS